MSSSPSPSLSRCCLVSTVSHSVTVLHRHLSTSTEVQIARSTFPNLSTMASSQNTEENSLDPNSPHTNRVHAFPQPLVQIVGFELPGLPSERNLVSRLHFIIHPNCTPMLLYMIELKIVQKLFVHSKIRSVAKSLNYQIQEN